MIITRDYETLSFVDLRKTGAAKYAAHPSTDVYCMAIKKGEEKTTIWVNPRFLKMLPSGHNLPITKGDLYEGDFITESHNDPFEQAIDRYVTKIDIPIERRRCSAAQAATNALPRKLETLTHEALFKDDPKYQKDTAGHELMLKMCKPLPMTLALWKKLDDTYGEYPIYQKARAAYKAAKSDKGQTYFSYLADHWGQIESDGFNPHTFVKWHYDTPEGKQDLVRLCQYCIQDVEAEYAASQAMPPMNESEQKLWVLDQTLRILLGDDYAKEVEAWERPTSGRDEDEDDGWYEWETGIAP